MSSLVPRVTCPPAPSASRYPPRPAPLRVLAAWWRARGGLVVVGSWSRVRVTVVTVGTRGPGGGLVVVGSRPAPVSRLVADSWWSRVGSWWWALRLVVTARWRARGRLVTGVVGSWWRARSRLQSRVSNLPAVRAGLVGVDSPPRPARVSPRPARVSSLDLRQGRRPRDPVRRAESCRLLVADSWWWTRGGGHSLPVAGGLVADLSKIKHGFSISHPN